MRQLLSAHAGPGPVKSPTRQAPSLPSLEDTLENPTFPLPKGSCSTHLQSGPRCMFYSQERTSGNYLYHPYLQGRFFLQPHVNYFIHMSKSRAHLHQQLETITLPLPSPPVTLFDAESWGMSIPCPWSMLFTPGLLLWLPPIPHPPTRVPGPTSSMALA